MRWSCCQFVGIQPLLAALTTLSVCLGFANHRIRMERCHRRFLQYSVGVNRPGAFCPGSDHASLLLIVCYCRGSSHRARVAVTVAARGTAAKLLPILAPVRRGAS